MHQFVADEVEGEPGLSLYREAEQLSTGEQDTVVGVTSHAACTSCMIVNKKLTQQCQLISSVTSFPGPCPRCTCIMYIQYYNTYKRFKVGRASPGIHNSNGWLC